MKTFKTTEEYMKYVGNFMDTFQSNRDFMLENGITMVLSFSINDEPPNTQIIFGEPVRVGANLCVLIRHLPKGLPKSIYKALRKRKIK